MSDPTAPYVLMATGRLDALTSPHLDAELLGLSAAGESTIIVDLSAVTYISSSGLRVLLLAHRRQEKAGGRLLLCHPTPRVQSTLHLCGLDRVLSFCPLTPAVALPHRTSGG
jgi:anti-sigma B factor antagonist